MWTNPIHQQFIILHFICICIIYIIYGYIKRYELYQAWRSVFDKRVHWIFFSYASFLTRCFWSNNYAERVYRWKCVPCIPECHGWRARPVLSRTVPLTVSKPLASQHPSEDISQSLEKENEKSKKSKEKRREGGYGNKKGDCRY